MASPSSPMTRTRWQSILRPRFGLAFLLALVALASIGSWYWWRRPFVIERTGLNDSLGTDIEVQWGDWPPEPAPVDPFDPFSRTAIPTPKSSPTQQSSNETPRLVRRVLVIAREEETVRRLWGGKTIRNGRVVGYDADERKLAESHYREGALHGPATTWFRDGRVREQGEYRDGKKDGSWVRYSQWFEERPPQIVLVKSVAWWKLGVPEGEWEWFDTHGASRYACTFEMGRLTSPPPALFDRGLARRLTAGEFDDPGLVLTLLAPSEFEFVGTPLKDAIDFLSEKHEVPILLDARRMEESGVNIDSPITLRIQQGPPLIECLARILEPLRLVGDYRYGLLTITTPQGIAAADTSGVSQISIPPDSLLANVWNRRVTVELVKTPLAQALGFMEKQVGLKGMFVFENVPSGQQKGPVTMLMRNHPFRHVLWKMLEEHNCHASIKEGNVIVITSELNDQGTVVQ